MTKKRRSYSTVVQQGEVAKGFADFETFEDEFDNESEQGEEEMPRGQNQEDIDMNGEVLRSMMAKQGTNGDNPELVLVSTILTRDNYFLWCRSMLLALSAKRKMSFIERDDMPEDRNAEAFRKWKETDDLVFSWIINAVSKDIGECYMYAASANHLWDQLKESYGRSNGPMIFQLGKEICGLTQGSSTLVEFFNRIKRKWDELQIVKPILSCRCGEANKLMREQAQEEQLMQFLSGVNPEFDTVRDQILLMDPLPSINAAFSMMICIETQRKTGGSMESKSNEFAHFSAASQNTNGGGGNRNFNGSSSNYNRNNQKNYRQQGAGNDSGFNRSGGRSYSNESKEDKYCNYCRKGGHDRSDCFRLNGYPEWFKGKRVSGPGSAKHQAHMAKETQFNSPLDEFNSEVDDVGENSIQAIVQRKIQKGLKSKGGQDGSSSSNLHEFSAFAGACVDNSGDHKGAWVVDSGATTHMTYDMNMLYDVRPLSDPKKMYLPSGEVKLVELMGKVDVVPGFTLMQVLYVPTFHFHLMSVSQLLQDQQVKVQFVDDKCVLLSKSGSIVAVALLQQGLYYLCPNEFQNSTHRGLMAASTEGFTSANVELWHKRLGHMSKEKLGHIHKYAKVCSTLASCDVCLRSKQVSSAFGHSSIKILQPFDLVHMDCWGPYQQVSCSGDKYYQVSQLIAAFVAMIGTQFEKKIKVIRTDNGTEFIGFATHYVFQSNGILHQRTCPHTPQQNGVVERRHRSLTSIARALLKEGHLPVKFWGEAILHAAILLNVSPTPVLKWKSPYEVLHGKLPNYSQFKVFGCSGYVLNKDPQKGKFADRSAQCVYVGNSPGQKGWKMYSLTSHKMVVSRDVKFQEDNFPYNKTVSYENVESVPVITVSDSTCHYIDVDEDVPSVEEDQLNEGQLYADQHENQAPSLVRVEQTTQLEVRRSTRSSHTPHWLNDFVVNQVFVDEPIVHLTDSYKACLSVVSQIIEPKNYQQAKGIPEWELAMKQEVDALEDNKTWLLTYLPAGKKAITCKWLFKTKFAPDGTIVRYKARLVARGYDQELGIDYHEVFSPVTKVTTVRVFLAIAVVRGWSIQQIYINNAYLHGSIDEEIYMVPPEGYTKAKKGMVCKLIKSLYGLKQAGRQWNKTFTEKLLEIGFIKSIHDYCLFTRQKEGQFIVLIVYVDDVLISGTSNQQIKEVKQVFHKAFTIKDLGEAKFFLGIELARSSRGMLISQQKYIRDLITDMKLTDAIAVANPFPVGVKFDVVSPKCKDAAQFRRSVGRLLYLGFTRPDLAFITQQLSQCMGDPIEIHFMIGQHVVKYLKGTMSTCLFYSVDGDLSCVEGFSDSNWGRCKVTRKSITGYCVFIGGCLVSWKSKKQGTCSRSSAEAEYRAMATTSCELKWLSYLLDEFDITPQLPIPLRCDNQAAIHIAANPVFHEQMKHVKIDCHIVREHLQRGFLCTPYVASHEQLADILTKSLTGSQMDYAMSKMKLLTLSS
ncbi:Retrovirus-related Pol polyprotein from transposon RE1 [Euphorbia peplus]|nr:Retrovirus-related Pol polyprotein from transposon RE1 [Euphorbia peplus]